MDAVDQEGRAFVGYHARLKWSLITIDYDGFTLLPKLTEGLQVKQKNNFASTNAPESAGDQIHWNCNGVTASWQQLDTSIEEILLSTDQGEIRWSCFFPKAHAILMVGNDRFAKALGYVEKITLTIPPWKIPIRELHWGRYLANDQTIIWIRWIGPVDKKIVFHNGRRIEGATITALQIQFDAYTLNLKNQRSLRKGTILSTIFSNFPKARKIFPQSIMNLKENKWSSEGKLFFNGAEISSGTSIHELVIWS